VCYTYEYNLSVVDYIGYQRRLGHHLEYWNGRYGSKSNLLLYINPEITDFQLHLVHIRALILLYQINADECKLMLLKHHCIGTQYHIDMLQLSKSHNFKFLCFNSNDHHYNLTCKYALFGFQNFTSGDSFC